jgi:hypothetical protein
VISVTEQPTYADVLTRLQAELPHLSSNSLHILVEGATHESLVADPRHAATVVEIIRRVLRAVETGATLGASE